MNVNKSMIAFCVLMVALLLWLFRVEIGYALVVGLFLRLALHRAGYRPRRGSSFAAKVTAVSAAYGAWNTRWLKSRAATATIPASVGEAPTLVDAKGYPYRKDDIPY